VTIGAWERRLEAVSDSLGGRERAVLYLRAWATGQATEAELKQLQPRRPDAEFDGVVQAVEQVNNAIYQNAVFWLEWTVNTTHDVPGSTACLATRRAWRRWSGSYGSAAWMWSSRGSRSAGEGVSASRCTRCSRQSSGSVATCLSSTGACPC
jgi:hypothetical protein